MVVGKDRLDEEPGASDGNHRNKPDRPQAAQAVEVTPENPCAVRQARQLEKALPETLVDHKPGDQRGQQRQAQNRDQVPAPAETIGEGHQPPAVQGAGKALEVETGAFALDHAAVRVDVDLNRAAVGIGHIDAEGKMRFVGPADLLDDQLWLRLLDGSDDLVIAEQFGVIGRFTGTDVRVGQPDDFLADHRQRPGDADDQQEEPDGQCQPAMDQKPDFRAGFLRHGMRVLVAEQGRPTGQLPPQAKAAAARKTSGLTFKTNETHKSPRAK
ncbi:hypothetical protein D9M71_200860 [compost metagenome]